MTCRLSHNNINNKYNNIAPILLCFPCFLVSPLVKFTLWLLEGYIYIRNRSFGGLNLFIEPCDLESSRSQCQLSAMVILLKLKDPVAQTLQDSEYHETSPQNCTTVRCLTKLVRHPRKKETTPVHILNTGEKCSILGRVWIHYKGIISP